MCATQYGGPQSAPKHLSAPAQRIHTMSALCKFMHGAAKVCWAPFPPRAQHQHSGCQLWLRLCFGGHAGAYGEGVGMTDQQDILSPDKARAFNQFLCARTDNLKALIAEVQTQLGGYEFFHQTRKRVRRPADQVTYERTVEAILCDLCAVELEPHNDSIHLPLSNKVLRSKVTVQRDSLGQDPSSHLGRDVST